MKVSDSFTSAIWTFCRATLPARRMVNNNPAYPAPITRMISTKEEGRGGTFVTDNRYICRNASVLVNHRTPPLDTPGTSSGEEIRLRNYRGARGKLGLWRRKLW